MILKNKNKFKPLYKKFIKLRENAQNRHKVLNFKKQKWNNFVQFYQRKLKWYKKFKPQNQNKYLVSKYSNKHSSYQNRYKNTLQHLKIFKLFYGDMQKSVIKKKIFKSKKNNYKLNFLKLFEKRLDVILYRARFCYSLRNAQQFIVHGKVFVNNKIVKSKSYLLKSGDLISLDLKYFELIEFNLSKSKTWPIPPKHLTINYKTMQIIFNDIENTNISLMFPFNLNLEKILVNSYRQ